MDILVRTTAVFAVLLALTRLLGKKQLSQLTVFTYITGITLGEMAGEMIMQRDVPFLEGAASMAIWSALVLIVEFVSLKSAPIRVLLDAEPTIVIKNGQIIERALRKQRLNLDDLSMQLRQNDVFSILDVEYAILEPNGVLTVMKKWEKEEVTKLDLHLPPEPVGMPSEIITDGRIVERNLRELGYTREMLADELRRQGVTDVKAVLYAELQADGTLYVQSRQPKGVL